jgi:hypothetical protein
MMSDQKITEQENNNLMDDDEIVTDEEMKMMLSHLTVEKIPDDLSARFREIAMQVHRNYLKELRNNPAQEKQKKR